MVTGTYDPLSLDEIDRAITLLPARNMTLLIDNLVDLLRLDPSLDLQERAPGGVQTDLSIRGGSFGQTLVLLNGQRLNDVQSGHHDMDIPVPVDSVTRIEVLRGSGSTLYGSDAMAGVINIITAPPEGLELRLRTAVGNQGINQQRVSLADSFGKLSEQLTFSRDFSTGFIPDRDYRNLQFASTTHLITAWGPSDLTLAYMDHPFGADQFYGPYPSWEDTKTWWAGLQQALGKKTTASFAYRRHSDLFVLFRDQPADLHQSPRRRKLSGRGAAHGTALDQRQSALRRRGAARIHRQQQSRHPCAQPRRRLRGGRFPGAQALLAVALGARRVVSQLLRASSARRSPAASGFRRR